MHLQYFPLGFPSLTNLTLGKKFKRKKIFQLRKIVFREMLDAAAVMPPLMMDDKCLTGRFYPCGQMMLLANDAAAAAVLRFTFQSVLAWLLRLDYSCLPYSSKHDLNTCFDS